MLDTYVLAPVVPDDGPESLQPDIRVLESEETYGRVAVEPLQRGFGLTIGNPLRRILLSSTHGSAITWVKIDDVVHEYAAIPGVKEEVMELLLNIKRIRIRSQSDRAGKMRLDVTGEGRICAGDISTSSDFEIVNPELHLATLDDDSSHLAVEFNVEQGVGYQPALPSDATTNPPVGVLPVDAVFSPVRKVNYHVERTRVGQVTDYERLVMEVWTDGTIKPVEAVQQAAENLVNHFFLFSNLNRVAEEGIDRAPLVISPEIYQMPIEKLELSPRTLNCLKRAHISRVGEVLEMSDEDLLKIRNFGDKALVELQDKLAENGIVGPSDQSSPEEPLGGVPELTADDLGELMGGGELVTDPESKIGPGMTIEEFDKPAAADVSADDDGGDLDYDGQDDF